ncbi:hypothetical protein ACOSQ3_016615 [Xanthoceras sorbifolium]
MCHNLQHRSLYRFTHKRENYLLDGLIGTTKLKVVPIFDMVTQSDKFKNCIEIHSHVLGGGLDRDPTQFCCNFFSNQKREAPAGEKPEPVRTHLRNMIIVREMIGSIIGVYNGKTFNQVEIKPEMIGHYLAEFSISYKPVKHGRPGIGATYSSRFIPLK